MDALWLRPPGVRDPGQLIRVFGTTSNDTSASWSYPEYLDLGAATSSLEGFVARGRRGTSKLVAKK